MKKILRTIIIMVVSLAISVGLSYWWECHLLEKGLDNLNPVEHIDLWLFAIPFVACQIVFIILSAITKWFRAKSASLVIVGNSILYILLMILLFQELPVAYELSPRGEMAFGYAQVLMQFIACIPAAICGVIAGIVALSLKVSGK